MTTAFCTEIVPDWSNRSGKERKIRMKRRFIPTIIAIVLIVIIGLFALAWKVIRQYSYSDEQQDMNEYYSISQENDVAIVLQDELIETKAKLLDGTYYLDFSSVQELLNDRFYWDFNENLLIYTTPTQIITSTIGTTEYDVSGQQNTMAYQIARMEGDTLYVALDYVKLYTNFSYEAFTEPDRIQMDTKWGERSVASVSKNTNVRKKGGVKSPILRPVTEGEEVTVLEKMDKWTKVKTQDAVIGYIENKLLSGESTVEEIPVTDYVQPEYTSQRRDHKINLAWHQVMGQAANEAIGEVTDGTGSLNVISPTWFSLSDENGAITSLASSTYVNSAHAKNMEVWALVDNFSDEVNTTNVLSFTSKRGTLINNLISQCTANGIDGINVDFEELSYDAGEHFTEFLRELSIACRANNLVLSVDNYVPRESTTHYNRKEQGVVADYVIIMGYDEHWGGGGIAGSVASIGFVEDGIKKTLEEVPAEKVINAIPFYTRIWATKNEEVTSKAVGMEAAQSFLTSKGMTAAWDETTCQNYAEAQIDDTFYQVWLEDQQSIETKLTIMKQYELAGVAEWKLGFETSSIWGTIDSFVK